MEASEVPYANEGLPTFTCFSRLPLELREMISERRISVQRHLRIEGRWGKPATIGSFSISEGMDLSRVCSESRKVLSRIIAYQTAEDGDGASIKQQFSIVLLTILDTPSLEILASLKNDIYCIAVPRLAVGQLKKLHLSLKKRVAAGSRQIKVIYTGTRPYLQDQWQCRPPGNYLVKPLADFYVMADDAVSSLGCDKSFTVRTTEEEKEFRFFNSPFWSAYQSPKELCLTWMRLTSKDGVPAPVIRPSLITIPRS
ncbi:uncharacterized protein FSUBG_2996 [Fusarium subglutinans]|uniref:2EXR domain-containing protein n=1 Tax=Gibberella subglutinans TaxID=42677 RepID=A0A8H5Q6Y2_GIBSU|nr:uncharacterized protein FSUBG_2996 [Fusarium subglutinans]KAF5610735.1 hypothetical protein FSUBG_2996 [Fusarium subglutinans]